MTISMRIDFFNYNKTAAEKSTAVEENMNLNPVLFVVL